jgi:hypothetical protein
VYERKYCWILRDKETTHQPPLNTMGSTQSKSDTKKVNNTLPQASSTSDNSDDERQYPTPTGMEYDKLDSLLETLPRVIDPESQIQVEEYIKSCDNGKGPAVACFSTAEYLSLMEQNHAEAVRLYETTCFRPKDDKSPNVVDAKDGTKSYPPSCFNLARFRMTGKGQTKFSHKEGFELFARACDAGHHGACHFQARMLSSAPGSFEGVSHDPQKGLKLYEFACKDGADSFSCFTAATMLLRGDKVAPEANNVTPGEARGVEAVKNREGEDDRRKKASDQRKGE